MNITAKKEFIDVFKASNAISLEKGKSYFLARAPLKLKQQIKLEKAEGQKKENDIIILRLKDKIEALNAKLDEFEHKQLTNEDYAEKMGKLYDLGLIDEEGNPINNEMKLG